MNIDPPFDRLADAWMAEGPSELSDRVLKAALEQVQGRRQHRHRRATSRWAWRRLGRARYVLVAVGLIVIVAGIAVVGSIVLVRPPIVPPPHDGVVPQASPSQAPRPTHRPSPTPRPQVPLTKTFTSMNNKLTISYPADWTVKPATRAYRFGDLLAIGDDTVDVIAAPDGIRAVYMVSEQANPDGMTFYVWERTHRQLLPAVASACDYDPARVTFAVPIEGATNYVATKCGYIQVLSEFGDRGYQFVFFQTPVGTFSAEDLANRDLFSAMLKSAVLTP